MLDHEMFLMDMGDSWVGILECALRSDRTRVFGKPELDFEIQLSVARPALDRQYSGLSSKSTVRSRRGTT